MDDDRRTFEKIENGRADLLDDEDMAIMRSLLIAARSRDDPTMRIAAWLRERGELALEMRDQDDPAHREFAQGWRQGAHNALYVAASLIESGKAFADGANKETKPC